MPTDPIARLTRHRSYASCARHAAQLLAELRKATDPERRAVARAGVTAIFDPVPLMCDQKLGHAQMGKVPVFVDANHLSTQSVRAIAR